MVFPFGLTTASLAFTDVVKQIKKWANPMSLCSVSIPRRLAESSQRQRNTYPPDGRIDLSLSPVGIVNKPSQFRVNTVPVHRVSRQKARSTTRQSLPDREEIADALYDHPSHCSLFIGKVLFVHTVITWITGVHGADSNAGLPAVTSASATSNPPGRYCWWTVLLVDTLE